MHEAGGVYRRESAPAVHEHLDDAAPRVGIREPLAQGLTAHELHRDEHVRGAVVREVLADLVHRDHVRMRDAPERLRLATNPRREVRGVVRLRDQLDGDTPIEVLVIRGIDHAHAAAADATQHGVAADAGRRGRDREQPRLQ
ncbi:MAG: hypothetical protein IPK74_17130 [Deltaproteobacteria bacterium]|nr:hypothetical protein [Deltaproteobacteria bacterium]